MTEALFSPCFVPLAAAVPGILRAICVTIQHCLHASGILAILALKRAISGPAYMLQFVLLGMRPLQRTCTKRTNNHGDAMQRVIAHVHGYSVGHTHTSGRSTCQL